ncbi:hypothetical protein [Streptomyces microflavus]|uniref:hypothetical protein n=1 Tax=Streptomyces microflavus TaxID=1919 RepID=UPI002E37287A|nr:hypothetical protein [Streptomyces microflavus]
MHITITPANFTIAAGVATVASLLIAHRLTRKATQDPAPQQLTDAHRAGYALALTHVSRGLLAAAPEEP